MKIWEDIGQVHPAEPTAVALGAFDGLHRGHKKVIEAAQLSGSGASAVFTFTENPHGGGLLLQPEEKERLLADWGIRHLFRIPFASVRQMEPEEFLKEILLKRCRAAALSCGEDFRFGRGAGGDVQLLRSFGEKHGMKTFVLPEIDDGGGRVSSTRIRTAVEEGDIRLANRLLGRRFGYAMPVIKGNQIGRTLGTPTINQLMPPGFVIPRFAIYASWVEVNGRRYEGVTNIGVKPTVGSDTVLSETWIRDFSGDLYGQSVRVELVDFIRPEVKFDTLEELRQAILDDAEKAQALLSGAVGKG